MPGILKNLAQVWQRIGMVQRVLLVAMLLVCGGAAAGLIHWARLPSMAMLYSRLSPEEAARIVEKVRDAGIAYELKEGGTSVYVPQEKVYSLRLTMAGQGLPAGDQAGYRILDEEKIGASPFTQRVNYLRAVEGELAKTVQLIEGVASARVHVAAGEPGLFTRQDRQVSATVALRLKGGWKPTGANVAAIVHLVASSVAGLRPENVTVVDNEGNHLSGVAADESAQKINTLFDYQKQREEYYARKIREVLEPAVGRGNVSVQVNAVIERTSMEETSEKFDPNAKLVQKQVTKDKTVKAGAGKAADGAAEPPEGESTEDNTLETTYFDPPKTVTRKIDPPGKVTEMSVAAMVDLSASAAGKEDDKSAAPAPPLTLEQVKKLITNVVGQDAKVEVTQARFVHPPPAAAPAKEGSGLMETILPIVKQASLGILVIGLLLAMKMLGGSKKPAPALAGGAMLALESAGVGPGNLLPAGLGEGESGALRARISRALQENPEEVKRLFLSWAAAEEGEA